MFDYKHTKNHTQDLQPNTNLLLKSTQQQKQTSNSTISQNLQLIFFCQIVSATDWVKQYKGEKQQYNKFFFKTNQFAQKSWALFASTTVFQALG
eukprot:TRINITY_DN53_c0_g1_i12.p1 TRINITY_DN53_c0_g1~~TRINITY_DN53_c0_g1_i12.p1  ORF type:complete len:105 (+),score=0.67 TRINITY_DN53_c0_g1_i12:34-315(+)